MKKVKYLNNGCLYECAAVAAPAAAVESETRPAWPRGGTLTDWLVSLAFSLTDLYTDCIKLARLIYRSDQILSQHRTKWLD